ncbi:MAG: DUF2442 domain-containing protein [Hydrogenophilales bacterium CG_4_9_14_3_um_filter_63_34]|nr:MAG: DUF2442 domain-containing protein [Hydrogenophilales bacterium CG_4_10_14_3_um_filter_63_21]PJB04638.1 MAG: DUF2442 domain-containing protein [Hydrogenophilales bacterium CG_4_9_14_3_um_filter_63_34]
MLLKIEQADALSPFHIRLRFNDGRTGEVDIHPLFEEGAAGIFRALRDAAVADDFRLEYGTLCWPGDLDVAPEYLYFLAFREDPALHEQFADWGYLEAAAHA